MCHEARGVAEKRRTRTGRHGDICHTLIFDPEITGSGGVYTAIVWMCKKQIGRRNITDEQRTVLIGEAYKAQKMSKGGDRGNQFRQ